MFLFILYQVRVTCLGGSQKFHHFVNAGQVKNSLHKVQPLLFHCVELASPAS